jgi:hypothetical protein
VHALSLSKKESASAHLSKWGKGDAFEVFRKFITTTTIYKVDH